MSQYVFACVSATTNTTMPSAVSTQEGPILFEQVVLDRCRMGNFANLATASRRAPCTWRQVAVPNDLRRLKLEGRTDWGPLS